LQAISGEILLGMYHPEKFRELNAGSISQEKYHSLRITPKFKIRLENFVGKETAHKSFRKIQTLKSKIK
jgi:hypothetical protein